jgi:two-component system CheB/CheR fusion protein
VVLHELVGNAAQHGSLSKVDGRLSVSWTARSEDGGFTLVWEECGASATAADPDPGFGMMMIKGMVEKQLRGAVEHSWRPDGLVVSLSLPGLKADFRG